MAEVTRGPWGPFMDVVLSLAPIGFLLAATLVPHPLPTTTSLPLSALICWFIRIAYFAAEPNAVTAQAFSGALAAVTPVTIVAGAIFLFESMDSASCILWMRFQMQRLTNGHAVAEIMLIGWAFAYLIEGASGFGTPAALASPILIGMGHPKFETVCCLLLMNIFATVFGAVGTPVWFGFGSVFKKADGTLDEASLREVALAASIALAVSAVLLVPLVVRLLVSSAQVRQNLLFIELSVLSCCVPNVLIAATFSYEFPTLLGGVLGMAGTAALVHWRVGLSASSEHAPPPPSKRHADGDDAHGEELSEPKASRRLRPTAKLTKLSRVDSAAHHHHHDARVLPRADDADALESVPVGRAKPPPPADAPADAVAAREPAADDDDAVPPVDPALEARLRAETSVLAIAARTSPIWATVLLLLLTRIEQIGLKRALRASVPRVFMLRLGQFGDLTLSASCVLGLERILDEPAVAWSYEVFYVPALLPFAVSGSLALLLYRHELRRPPLDIVRGLAARMRGPAVSLIGAIALVNMLRSTGEDPAAPATVIGVRISRAISYGWLLLAAPIGTLGSFFSGSTTVSNLTFGATQAKAATLLGVSPTAMCAIQAVGGSFGNAVCLSNIIAASTVVKLRVSEGEVMKRTGPIVLAAWVVGTATILPFVFSMGV